MVDKFVIIEIFLQFGTLLHRHSVPLVYFLNMCYFNPFPNKLVFMCLKNKPFENTVGKGETACNEQYPF